MVGRDLEKEFPSVELKRGEEVLRVENVRTGLLQAVNLTLHKGEVLGLAGLVGAGRTELARVIFGADQREGGEVYLEGKAISPCSPREAIDLGIGLLTEDRNAQGLIMQMNIRENTSLSNLSAVVRAFFINHSMETSVANRYIHELRIKTHGAEQGVESLSGGNRQKVVLARWLFTQSKVLMFDEPTSGIDVGVKFEIYGLINSLAQQGTGILVISSDLPELLGLCTRIVVMHEGRIMGEMEKCDATQEGIMAMATGGTNPE